MNHLSVRRRALAVAALSAASVAVACQDKRVKAVDTGITRDSAMSVISHDLKPGTGPDSFPNVYKRERFLIGGKNYEVLYFNGDNAKQVARNGAPAVDTVPLKKLTPIVLVENRVVGKGWDYWDSVATANKIPIKKP
jgi:hypothetical protein